MSLRCCLHILGAGLRWRKRGGAGGYRSDLKESSAAERRGNNLKGFKVFYLKAKASIWPGLSYVCHIRGQWATGRTEIRCSGTQADPGTPYDPTVGNRIGPYQLPVPGERYRRLVFQAHRLLYHSTLGLRVNKKKKTGRI